MFSKLFEHMLTSCRKVQKNPLEFKFAMRVWGYKECEILRVNSNKENCEHVRVTSLHLEYMYRNYRALTNY